ncbi:hypothetical protein Q0F98_30330 [Paenibacillus amylolyticus]|nr:hypothetical protein Q0F98_30330 [Paenibacillus amylolyticus]
MNEAASKYSNVSLIDWNSASEGHDEYFEKMVYISLRKGPKLLQNW